MTEERQSVKVLVEIIKSQQEMIAQLHDRLMAKSLPEYGQFCDVKASYPEFFSKIDELMGILRRGNSYEQKLNGNGEDLAMPSISEDEMRIRRT